MNEEELYKGLKEIATIHLKALNDGKKELKKEIYDLKEKKSILKKYLSMIKDVSDAYKSSNLKYYHKYVEPILGDMKDEFVKDYNEDEIKTESRRLHLIMTDELANANQVLVYTKMAIKIINEKIDSIKDIDEYTKEIKRIKIIQKSISENSYFKSDEATNLLLEYVENTDYNDDVKEKLLEMIKNKRSEYLAKIEELKNKEIVINEPKKDKEVKKEEIVKNRFRDSDFFNEDDMDLIKEVNRIIFKDKDNLSKMDFKHLAFLEECLKYSDEEILHLSLLKDKEEIDNSKNLVILFKIQKLLKNLDKIIDYLKSNDYTDNEYEKATNLKDKLLLQIQNLFINYKVKEVEEIIEKEDKKYHIVYLKGENGNTLFESYLDKTKEYYPLIIKLLNDLSKGITYKDGNYTDIGKSIYKKRVYNTRLVYVPYGDIFIVFYCFIKKNQKASYEIDMIKNVYNSNKGLLDELIRDLNNPEKKDEILSENDIIHKRIMDDLNSKSRGKII